MFPGHTYRGADGFPEQCRAERRFCVDIERAAVAAASGPEDDPNAKAFSVIASEIGDHPDRSQAGVRSVAVQDDRRTQDAIKSGDPAGDRRGRVGRARTKAPSAGGQVLQFGFQGVSGRGSHQQRSGWRVDRTGHPSSVQDAG